MMMLASASTRYLAYRSAQSLCLVCRAPSNVPLRLSVYLHKQLSSTAASSTKSSSSSSSSSSGSSKFYYRLARIVRYTRIPFLVVSVYGLGYQQGIIDDSSKPQQTRGALLDSVISSVGISSRDQVDFVQEGEQGEPWLSTVSLFSAAKPKVSRPKPTTRRVAKIGRRILEVAKVHIQEQIQKEAARVSDTLAKESPSKDITEEELVQALLQDEEFSKWVSAREHVLGDWSYLLLDSPHPNAFVSEMLPKRIFITTSMAEKVVANDDELALILGHEVSHLMLGHVSESNRLDLILRTVEVLLLSMDPTEGLLSLAFVSGLAGLRSSLEASFSREHEREADQLGIKLAAMACFDTSHAAQVFKRLHQMEKPRSQYLRFADSHPPTAERYDDLIRLSTESENRAETYCGGVRRNLRGALGGVFQ